MNWYTKIGSNRNIEPTDIVDFYLISYFIQSKSQFLDKDVLFEFKERLSSIRSTYLSSLSTLVREQLKKYVERGRTDKIGDKPSFDLEKEPTDSQFEFYDKAMRQTYRSDLKRRNVSWESLTSNLKGLSGANDVQSIIAFVDRINNDIHNTKELILTKLLNGDELTEALDFANKASPSELFMRCSRNIRLLSKNLLPILR